MLTELRVRDLAVIRDVSLQLAPGLNVLTGETGAGKSMLVDALALLLGERASSDIVRPGADTAVVEAAFDIESSQAIEPIAGELGVDLDDGRLVVRRDINAAGRNRAWANGSPSTVATLATLSRTLVDLHGQHEAQSLLNSSAQRDILDAFGGLRETRQATVAAFSRLSALKAGEAELARRREEVSRKSDYLQHVAREIAEAAVRDGEDEDLDIEAKRLGNVDALTRNAEALLELLDGEDNAALSELSRAGRVLSQLERIDESVGTWRELLEAAEANVAELIRTVRDYAEGIDADPARLGQVERRRDQLYRLKQKYGPALSDVVRAGEDARRELELLDTADFDLERIAEQREEAEREFAAVAAELSSGRKQAGSRLERAVEKLLPGLGMDKGRFEVRVQSGTAPTSTGCDSVEFLVTLNVGMAPRPLSQVASGGELSRLMLALKVVLAQHDAIPTLVFDEVDQGIGGEVAVQVADALAHVADSRQVLIITHLPQIAARATHHLRVEKPVKGGMPSSEVHVLDEKGRVVELARMLGDADDSVALRHAEGMLKKATRSPA